GRERHVSPPPLASSSYCIMVSTSKCPPAGHLAPKIILATMNLALQLTDPRQDRDLSANRRKGRQNADCCRGGERGRRAGGGQHQDGGHMRLHFVSPSPAST